MILKIILKKKKASSGKQQAASSKQQASSLTVNEGYCRMYLERRIYE